MPNGGQHAGGPRTAATLRLLEQAAESASPRLGDIRRLRAAQDGHVDR